jgi:hypothetical protein
MVSDPSLNGWSLSAFGFEGIFTNSDASLAWLVFSGEKHADHGGVDELVALVYSSGNVAEMYHSLEGDSSSF